MTLQLDLQKSARTLRVSLEKAGVAADVKAELIFDGRIGLVRARA